MPRVNQPGLAGAQSLRENPEPLPVGLALLGRVTLAHLGINLIDRITVFFLALRDKLRRACVIFVHQGWRWCNNNFWLVRRVCLDGLFFCTRRLLVDQVAVVALALVNIGPHLTAKQQRSDGDDSGGESSGRHRIGTVHVRMPSRAARRHNSIARCHSAKLQPIFL